MIVKYWKNIMKKIEIEPRYIVDNLGKKKEVILNVKTLQEDEFVDFKEVNKKIVKKLLFMYGLLLFLASNKVYVSDHPVDSSPQDVPLLNKANHPASQERRTRPACLGHDCITAGSCLFLAGGSEYIIALSIKSLALGIAGIVEAGVGGGILMYVEHKENQKTEPPLQARQMN